MNYFPEEVLEHIFNFLGSDRDRNNVSTVCQAWYRIERFSRKRVFIGNCYAVRPERVAARFPRLMSLKVKGKHHFADFNLVPPGWGGFAHLWIKIAALQCPCLEEIHLKRMVITDDSLELLAHSLPNLKSLVLISCEGFSTDGLAAIATHCRVLRELDLLENEVEDRGSQWLSCFPESSTSLVTLNIACLKGEVSAGALERLVSRSPNLMSLRLNRAVTMETLSKILACAPKLLDLGTGSFMLTDGHSDTYHKLYGVFHKCKCLRSMSGFWNAASHCLPALYPICSNLTVLNLSYAPTIDGSDLIKLIQQCTKLQKLWILDCIGDKGLEVVATTCRELQELRVFPSDLGGAVADVTEEGLVSISAGCKKLNSVLYFCFQMTNVALITIAKNCPHFTRFRLCILDPRKPDPVTNEPLDEGFRAIVQSCKDLKRLSVSGLLTDQVFMYIGKYAERLEMLSIAFAGETDRAMSYVLNGCKRLRKLEIMDSPFGDAALLQDIGKYETMRSLWMSSCDVTLTGCKTLAAKMPRLNVEIMNHRDGMDVNLNDADKVDKLYVYRTIAGSRSDAPHFVLTL